MLTYKKCNGIKKLDVEFTHLVEHLRRQVTLKLNTKAELLEEIHLYVQKNRNVPEETF